MNKQQPVIETSECSSLSNFQMNKSGHFENFNIFDKQNDIINGQSPIKGSYGNSVISIPEKSMDI